jgi:signal peptidase I
VERRSPAARVGIALLNLLVPGSGLLRVGQLNRAASLLGIWLGGYLLLIGAFALTPNINFSAYALLGGTFLLIGLAVLLLSMWWTWTEGKYLLPERPFWSRWYSVIAAMLIAYAIAWGLTQVLHKLYHNFYAPSEAMEPTIDKYDRFVASMRVPTNIHRGDVILVKTDSGAIYVKRVAALPGDSIAMTGGIPLINGQLAATTPAGTRRVSYPYIDTTSATLIRERLPGEVTSHLIQDLGPSAEDDMHEIRIPADRIFVLGDNRDDSADSRVPKWMGGLELVPRDRVVGRALFFYWPFKKMGHPVEGPTSR